MLARSFRHDLHAILFRLLWAIASTWREVGAVAAFFFREDFSRRTSKYSLHRNISIFTSGHPLIPAERPRKCKLSVRDVMLIIAPHTWNTSLPQRKRSLDHAKTDYIEHKHQHRISDLV